MTNITPIIDHPSVWNGPDMLAQLDLWLRPMTPEWIEEIGEAHKTLRSRGFGLDGEQPLESASTDDFPLGSFAEDLAVTRELLQNGPGMQMYRGFPMDRYNETELREIYWGIAIHVGTPVPQSKFGDKVGDVRVTRDIEALAVRGYTSDRELTFHSDSCDLSVLFCLTNAKEGGLSRACSAVAVRNEIARQRPDILEVLYQPFMWSRSGNELPGTPAYFRQAVYGEEKGEFVTRYLREQMLRGFKQSGTEPSALQVEAMDLLDVITEDPRFCFTKAFEPGDIQFMNNMRVYHARTMFEDGETPDTERHLLRLWMAMPNSPPLPETFGEFYEDRRAGAVRGGHAPHDEILFETPRTPTPA